MTIKCTNCGKDTTADNQFCPHCGQRNLDYQAPQDDNRTHGERLYKYGKEEAPNGITSMILGICSIVLSASGISLIAGIIGLVMANRGLREFNDNPCRYNDDSKLKAGRITSIIGIVLSAMSIVAFLLFIFVIIGIATWSVSNGIGCY